jgi:hypothetical protein
VTCRVQRGPAVRIARGGWGGAGAPLLHRESSPSFPCVNVAVARRCSTLDSGQSLPGPNPCGARIAHALRSEFGAEVVNLALDVHVLEEVPMPPLPASTPTAQQLPSGRPKVRILVGCLCFRLGTYQ